MCSVKHWLTNSLIWNAAEVPDDAEPTDIHLVSVGTSKFLASCCASRDVVLLMWAIGNHSHGATTSTLVDVKVFVEGATHQDVTVE